MQSVIEDQESTNEELSATNNDLRNLLVSVNPPILMLDQRLHEVMDTMSMKGQEVCDRQGNSYSVSVHPYKTHDHRIDGVVITFFEHAQFDRLSRLATVVRDAKEAIAVLDFGGRIRAWNPAAERLHGYSEREAMALGLEALVPEAETDATRSLLDRARRRTKSGKELGVWLTISLLVDQTGAPKALSTIDLPVQPAPEQGPSEL